VKNIEVHPVLNLDKPRPTWSVIIPTYNCANYLKQTIESVLIQDRGIENMEIWVVDDCSSDNPREIVEEFGRGRVGFYKQEQNVGQLNNFSTCLNLSKGKIIHLLHGDDFVHNNFYESLEKSLLSDNNIGAGFTGHNVVNETGGLIVTSELLADNAGVIENFLSIITCRQVIQTPSIVVKREVYEKLGAFSKDLTWVEDWEMWIRIASNYKIYYEPTVLASYRVHNNSNTENSINTGRFVKDVLKCIKVYSSYLKVTKDEKKKIIQSAKQHYLNYARQQSRERVSVTILFRSLQLVYNSSSFFSILYQIPKIFFRASKYKSKIFLGGLKKKLVLLVKKGFVKY
jgi:glycosyltransferase involved in cell wall biosynthesis